MHMHKKVTSFEGKDYFLFKNKSSNRAILLSYDQTDGSDGEQVGEELKSGKWSFTEVPQEVQEKVGVFFTPKEPVEKEEVTGPITPPKSKI